MARYGESTGTVFESSSVANGAQYHEQMLIKMSTGTAPDLLFVEGPYLTSFVRAGFLKVLDEYYRRDVDLGAFLPMFDSVRRNGHYYGFPAVGGGYRISALAINRDLFHNGGLPIPAQRSNRPLRTNNSRM